MIKKLSIFLLVFSLCIIFFPSSVISQPVSLDPSDLYVTGEIGDLEIIQIEITNHENTSIDVTIEYVGNTEVYIPNNAIEIAPELYINYGSH